MVFLEYLVNNYSAMGTFPTPGIASIIMDFLEDHRITTMIAIHMNLLSDFVTFIETWACRNLMTLM
jgi:hypothetical protein